MQIHIKREQEFKKGGLLSGKNIKLILEVDVALTEEDRRLIEKYYDPTVSTLIEIKKYYDGTDEIYRQVKVDSEESNLSKFHLMAHVDDGHSYLGNIQEFEKAVVRALVKNLDYLASLDQWKGERSVTSEEE